MAWYTLRPEHATETLLNQALGTYEQAFGRSEARLVRGKRVMVQLIKNPVGATEVIKQVHLDPNARLLVALNDFDADGRDVSWIWDAGFEMLHTVTRPIWVSGHRAYDMATRLKYADIPDHELLITPSLKEALNQALDATASNETLYILPTYTALLALERLWTEIE